MSDEKPKDNPTSPSPDAPKAPSGWDQFGRFVYVVCAVVVWWLVATEVLRRSWGWFVTPAFGVPAPPHHVVLGLLLTEELVMFSVVRYRQDPEKRHLYVSDVERTTFRIFMWGAAGGLLYLVHTFGPHLNWQ